ncbi:hypothetical protein VULLAG_LOCUS273 [Vulpes lagopus]
MKGAPLPMRALQRGWEMKGPYLRGQVVFVLILVEVSRNQLYSVLKTDRADKIMESTK